MAGVVSHTAMGYNLSKKVCEDIVSILTLYTTSGVWREMVREVIRFISLAPHTFTPGLEILSQLLPLPLPMQILTPVTGAVLIGCLSSSTDVVKQKKQVHRHLQKSA